MLGQPKWVAVLLLIVLLGATCAAADAAKESKQEKNEESNGSDQTSSPARYYYSATAMRNVDKDGEEAIEYYSATAVRNVGKDGEEAIEYTLLRHSNFEDALEASQKQDDEDRKEWLRAELLALANGLYAMAFMWGVVLLTVAPLVYSSRAVAALCYNSYLVPKGRTTNVFWATCALSISLDGWYRSQTALLITTRCLAVLTIFRMVNGTIIQHETGLCGWSKNGVRALAILTVCSTVAFALLFEQVPFFPIDISFTAIAEPSKSIFRCGMMAVGSIYLLINEELLGGRTASATEPKPDTTGRIITIPFTETQFVTPRLLSTIRVACIGVVVLAVFDGKSRFALHILGAAMCFIGGALACFIRYGFTPLGLSPLVIMGIRTCLGFFQWFAADQATADTVQMIRAPFQWATVAIILYAL